MNLYHHNILLDAKEEYTNKLIDLLKPRIYEGIESIYEYAKKINHNNSNILKLFQTYLADIPKWTNEIIQKECKRIKDKSGCSWIDELLTAIFVSYTKVLVSIKKSDKLKVGLKVPKSDYFIHKCYINIARSIWKRPDLFYDKVSSLEKVKNRDETDKIIEKLIKKTIRDELPIKDILVNYLDNDYTDDFENDMLEYLNGNQDKLKDLVENEVKTINTKEETSTHASIHLDINDNMSQTSIMSNGNFKEKETISISKPEQTINTQSVITTPSINTDNLSSVFFDDAKDFKIIKRI